MACSFITEGVRLEVFLKIAAVFEILKVTNASVIETRNSLNGHVATAMELNALTQHRSASCQK